MVFIEELVKNAKNGSEADLNDIIKRFKYFIIKQAGRYRIPSYDFEDLVQYGNLSIVKAVKFYKPGGERFTSYCTRAVINNFNALLKSQVKHYREVRDEGLLNIQVYDYKIEDECINSVLIDEAAYYLDKLPVIERRIIYEFYVNGKTLKNTALELNINYKTAVALKKKALIKLKKYLK